MNVVKSLYDKARTKRVCIYANPDGTFGFVEEIWSNDPRELSWVPRLWPDSRTESIDAAIREAASRVKWLTAPDSA